MPKCEDVLTIQNEIYIRKGSIEERKINAVKSVKKHPFPMGKQVYVETCTKYYVGDLVAVTETDFVLERAGWCADTGRFNEFMKTGEPKEFEPCNGPVIISRGAYVTMQVPSPVKIEVK